MNRYLGLRRDEQGQFLLRVEPGVVLSELRKQLSKKVLPTAGWDQASLEAYEEFQEAPEQFFPTDPTEASACLGGMAACNASGARSYAYGPMRPHITGLHVALADGDLLELQRGEAFAQGRHLSLVTAAGRALELDLPSYTMPKTKMPQAISLRTKWTPSTSLSALVARSVLSPSSRLPCKRHLRSFGV